MLQWPQLSITLASSCRMCSHRRRRIKPSSTRKRANSRTDPVGWWGAAAQLCQYWTLWTPTPNSIPTCSFVPGWTIHSVHKYLYTYSYAAILHSIPVHQGLICAQLYVCVIRLTSITECCSSGSTAAFSPLPDLLTGYEALLSLVPLLLQHALLVVSETQTHISTLFSGLLVTIFCKGTAFLPQSLDVSAL